MENLFKESLDDLFKELLDDLEKEDNSKKEESSKVMKSGVQIECWDHCSSCDRSSNRFWVYSMEQFDKEKAEVLGHKCSFCGSSLTSYHE